MCHLLQATRKHSQLINYAYDEHQVCPRHCAMQWSPKDKWNVVLALEELMVHWGRKTQKVIIAIYCDKFSDQRQLQAKMLL